MRDILKEIQDNLTAIEKQHGVRILLAVESGSRAWGFASPDSDYDVRFVYVRDEADYLRIDPLREVIEWQLDDGVSTLLPTMQSDIMLTCGGKTLIIDAKYYSHATQVQFGKHTLHSNNIYQIFAYVKNRDVGNTGNVAGLLLYAKTDEDITPDMTVVMSGNQIGAKTLDLNCEFKDISTQLKSIAKGYFEY